MNTTRPLVDPARMACLGTGTHAAVAVNADGDEGLWLLLPDVDDDTPATGCCCPRHAPHEQAGPLPAPYDRRLHGVPLRCGGTTLAGALCRTPVARPGDRCHRHRATDKEHTG